ncbi:MAG: 4-hydroxy-tetrahydrodipicolinate synthase [Planctomycetota bacterium]|nr:MAG: 4-hydroxy-tetrahydrodipicolinate synthase [Planctomycetota bacterium]
MLVTALITPLKDDLALDVGALERLVRFQLAQGTSQVLLFGTTGEGATLSEAERARALDAALSVAPPERLMVSLGPGRPDELLARGHAALSRGVRDLLLVDCPYARPSSDALRRAWHGPLAQALPEARLFPYAVPSRTGSELLPDDLARLVQDHPNVVGVKDATGRLARMTRVRDLCGDDFVLLCGDDGHLMKAVSDPEIRAQGGCSVASNLAPAAMLRLLECARAGDSAGALRRHEALLPLFGLVGLQSLERVELRGELLDVPQVARNPAPLKAAMAQLALPGGPCRPPHAPLPPGARERLAALLVDARRRDRTTLQPILAEFALADGEALVSGAS